MGLHKILKIVVGVLGVVALVIAGVVATLDSEELQDELKGLGGNVNLMEVPSSISYLMIIAYIVLALILVLVIIFVLKGLASGNAKNTLIGVGAFLLVIAISYLMAPSTAPQEVMDAVKDGEVLTTSTLKWVGTGINAFFILGSVAIGLMLFSGAKKLVK